MDDQHHFSPLRGEQVQQGQTSLSPSFCKRVEAFLAEGNAEQAHALCREGVERYPHYATGHLVLGKTYEAMGRYLEALMEYEAVLRVVPDSQVARDRLQEIERREGDTFAEYVKKKKMVLRDATGGPSLEQYLAERPAALFSRTSPVGPKSQRFVTQTLAEIYVSQGEYDEAIEAYRRLSEQRPANAMRYGERIEELEALRRAASEGGTAARDRQDE